MARAEGQRAKAAQLGAFATLVLVGCPSFPDVVPCGQLPDPTACPVGRGGTCEPRSCTALYDCVDGRWRLAEECD
ncbi:MAG: hypothetical protein KC731_07300, partial [Myxococcales bacterium]|nr:hypothetical protein [Myxococcales bacterium]